MRTLSGPAAVRLILPGCASTWASPAGSSTPIGTPTWRLWPSSSPRTTSSVQVWHAAPELRFHLGGQCLCDVYFFSYLFSCFAPSRWAASLALSRRQHTHRASRLRRQANKGEVFLEWMTGGSELEERVTQGTSWINLCIKDFSQTGTSTKITPWLEKEQI